MEGKTRAADFDSHASHDDVGLEEGTIDTHEKELSKKPSRARMAKTAGTLRANARPMTRTDQTTIEPARTLATGNFRTNWLTKGSPMMIPTHNLEYQRLYKGEDDETYMVLVRA